MNNTTHTPEHTPYEGTQLNRQELLAAIRHDCVAFFALYLADELTLAVPDLHVEIWDELLQMVEEVNQGGVVVALQKLFAVPRGFAKSTVAKLAVILFLHYTPLKFALYASKTVGHGKNAIRDIIAWLCSDQCVDLHGGSPKVIKANDGEALWILKIPIRNHITMEVTWKQVIFKGVGADSHIRGFLILNQRPQIIIIDDIEDTDNTTPELQPKLDIWFMGSFWKSFDANRRVAIFIGNMIRKTTLLARLSKDPEWNPIVFGAIVKDKITGEIRSLWEEKFPLAGLLKEYRAYRRVGTGEVWEAEMMNLTQDEIFSMNLDTATRPPTPSPEDIESGFLVLDPSFGKNKWNDDTAIAVHARIKGLGIPALLDVVAERITEDAMFDKMLELSYYWGISTWLIEADVAQALIIPYFNLLFDNRLMNKNAFTLLPISGKKEAKPARIIAFRSSVSGGNYAVVESLDDLLDTLIAFVPGGQRHDDKLDAAAFGVIGWTTYEPVIVEKGVTKNLFRIAHARNGEDQIEAEPAAMAF